MGIADLDLVRTTNSIRMDLLGGEVVETKPSAKKHGVRKGDDNMRRSRIVAAALIRHVCACSPGLLVYEAQSFGMKGVIAARQAGTAFGIIAAIAEANGLPMLCVTPGDIKRAVCPDTPKATKDDVILAVERLWPAVKWPAKRDNYEHLADAIAAGWACRDDELVRAVLLAERAA
jgi:Holliday junction resolvasome RuvABC endonuclease subunit